MEEAQDADDVEFNDEDDQEDEQSDSEEEDEVNVDHGYGDGGPPDKSMLVYFTHHIAKKLWDDPENDRGVLKVIHHPDTLRKWKHAAEPLEVKSLITRSTVWRTFNNAYKNIDQVLVTAFVERWHAETNSFHLPFGEMTITLDDVEYLMGIPMVGVSMAGEDGGRDIDQRAAVRLLTQYLGVRATDAMRELGTGTCVRLTWLRENFQGCPDDASPRRKEQVARAFLLHALGCVVVPDKSGNRVSVHYLQSLADLTRLGGVAWGMGILAFLYRQLGIATRSGVKQISGCLSLLVAWIYEHFDIRRPPMHPGYRDDFPRMKRWVPSQCSGDHLQALKLLRIQLDNLDADSVIWSPYDRENRPIKPYAWYSGILVCYNIAEPHYPERVLRQYGRRQTIPREPMKAPAFSVPASGAYVIRYDPLTWYQDNWRDHVLDEEFHSIPARAPADCVPRYLHWYLQVTHPRITIGPAPAPCMPRSAQLSIMRGVASVSRDTLHAIRDMGDELRPNQVYSILHLMEDMFDSTLAQDFEKVEISQKSLADNLEYDDD